MLSHRYRKAKFSSHINNKSTKLSIAKPHGFTIVELLVVIVVIGILATLTIISFSGVSQKATAVSLQSDLKGASTKLKMYAVEYGEYPSALSGPGTDNTYCPAAPSAVDNKYCFRFSSGNTIPSGTPYTGTTSTFSLYATNSANSITYRITESTAPTEVAAQTPPSLSSPTSVSVTNNSATIGANLTSAGGNTITALGTCWGTSPNPTTNCTSQLLGGLTAMTPATVTSGSGPGHVVISPDDKSVYVSNFDSDSISMYSRNATTGLLTALSPASIAAGYKPDGIVISPDGNSVYVANQYSDSISMYSRNATTGLLTALSPASITTGPSSYVMDLAISSDGSYVYAANWATSEIITYSRNPSTGLLTNIGITYSKNPLDLLISPDGTSFYAMSMANTNFISMYSRNPSTGLLTALSPASINTLKYGYSLCISPDGKSVYATNNGNSAISMYGRNTGTGLLTSLSPATISTGSSTYPAGIKVSQDGSIVYVMSSDLNAIYVYSRDTVSGILTSVPSMEVAAGVGPEDIAISNDGNSVYVANYMSNTSVSMYSRSSSFNTGAYTQARTGMPSNTLIYYRGYAISSAGTGYSSDGTFTTSP